jgi:hypothetical protein
MLLKKLIKFQRFKDETRVIYKENGQLRITQLLIMGYVVRHTISKQGHDSSYTLLIQCTFVFYPPCRDGSRNMAILGSPVLVIACNHQILYSHQGRAQ